jgi:hypothetical protein
VARQCVFCGFSQKFYLCCCDFGFILFLSIQVSLPYSRVGTASVLCVPNVVRFWTLEGLRIWLPVHVICRNSDNLFGTSFFFFRMTPSVLSNYVFIYSVVLLLITILFLMGSVPLNAIVLVVLIEICNPYFHITLSYLCINFCN